MRIIDKITHKYRRDGLFQFIQSGPGYIKRNYINGCLWRVYLLQNGITTSQLKNISSQKGRIYSQEGMDEYIEYMNPDKIALTEEKGNGNIFNKRAGHDPKERYACEVPDCVFFGGLAIPFHDGSCVLEPFGGEIDSFIMAKSTGFFENRIGLPDAISETYFNNRRDDSADSASEIIFPLVHWYKSYYHWIADYLPKLRMLEKYEKETDNQPKILVRKDSASYRWVSLEHLGYSPERIVEWETDDCITSRAVFTNHRGGQFEHSYQDYNWLRNRIFENVDVRNNEYDKKKIYVSRQGERDGENIHNDERYVVNFEPFRELLKSHGFKIVHAEEYSFEEQVQLFHSAEVIMGPHGGGLTNMIFGSDPFVIELFPDSFMIPLFSYLCDTLEFDYQPIVVESTNTNNLVVDIDDFDRALSDMDCLN